MNDTIAPTQMSPAPGCVEPIVVPWRYRATLALVAVAMILLPALYLALVALAAAAALAYAVYVWPILASWHVRSLYGLVLYAVPPIAGSVLVVFMLRSMWPARRPERGGQRLEPAEQPELHAWVCSIAEALGAPVPREIRVDLEVNASASLRRGIWSLGSRDLTLTVGLPLAAAFDSRQLAGIVAHELGHFAQRGGLGVSYLIRSINQWFARVVYERGAFDDGLERNAAQGHWSVGLTAQLARFFVWVSRKLLAGLMRLGWGLSGALSRQMEFDADRYEARLVGRKTAVATLAEMSLLVAAAQQAQGEIRSLWRQRRLPNDFAALVADHRQRLEPEVIESFDRERGSETTSWYDTHPTAAARAASLADEPEEGVFRDQRPARELFRAFDELCRRVSIVSFEESLGETVAADRLIDLGDLAARRAAEEREKEVSERIFGPLEGPSRPLPLDLAGALEAVPEPGATPEATEAAPAEISTPEAQLALAWLEHSRLEILATLQEAGLGIAGETLAQAMGRHPDLDSAREASRKEIDRVEDVLRPEDRRRALRVARAVARATPEERAEAEALARALALLDRTIPAIRQLARELQAVQILWPFVLANRTKKAFVAEFEGRFENVNRGYPALREKFRRQPNPFADHESLATLDATLFPALDAEADPAAVVGATQETLERWRALRRRCLARLAEITESVEGRG